MSSGRFASRATRTRDESSSCALVRATELYGTTSTIAVSIASSGAPLMQRSSSASMRWRAASAGPRMLTNRFDIASSGSDVKSRRGKSGLMRTSVTCGERKRRSEWRRTVGTRSPQPISTTTTPRPSRSHTAFMLCSQA
eukprot:Amastigsp_a882501_2.p2 type:complete len:139 gc:universal Amastigsp_a882501_2:545-129(-)